MNSRSSPRVEVRGLDHHERAMIAFAATWLPFGGADDLVFPEFGLSVGDFHARILDLLEHHHIDECLEPEQVLELRRFCRIRVAGTGRGSPGSAPTGQRRPLRTTGSRGWSSAVRDARDERRPA